MTNYNELPLSKSKSKKPLTRVLAFVFAFAVGILSFSSFNNNKVFAQSIPSYTDTKSSYSGLFNGFHLTSKGMLEFTSLKGEIGSIDHTTSILKPTASYDVTYNDNTAQIITSVDMTAVKRAGGNAVGVANVYYPLNYETSAHKLYQTLSTGDYANNYYLYSYNCNSINIELLSPRIMYLDSNLRTTDKLMLYAQIPSNLRLEGVPINNYYFAYRFGFSYRDVYGELQYVEIGGYNQAIYSQIYDNAIFFDFNKIYNEINKVALRNNNCYLIEDMYFNTNIVYFSNAHLDSFRVNKNVPTEQKYRLLFPELSPYDLYDDSGLLQFIHPFYTCEWVGNQYINFPLNTVTIEAESVAVAESSDMWLQYAYNDNFGVWNIFQQFFNIELFPNFKLSYLIIISFGILLISLAYKFIVV